MERERETMESREKSGGLPASAGEEEVEVDSRKGRTKANGRQERGKKEEPGEDKRQGRKETKRSRKKPLDNRTICYIDEAPQTGSGLSP